VTIVPYHQKNLRQVENRLDKSKNKLTVPVQIDIIGRLRFKESMFKYIHIEP